MSKYFITPCSKMIKPKTIKLVIHGLFCNLRRNTKSNTVTKHRKMLFANERFTLRTNVYVLLCGLK